MNAVNIYIATSINGVGKKKGKYIYLIETNTSKGLATVHDVKEIEATKEVAELTALVAAVSRLKSVPLDLNIYLTSSQLQFNIVRLLPGWSKRNFCKSDGRRLANYEMWKALYEKISIFNYGVNLNTHSYTKWLLKELAQ